MSLRASAKQSPKRTFGIALRQAQARLSAEKASPRTDIPVCSVKKTETTVDTHEAQEGEREYEDYNQAD
jgi:hypothetical protein